MKAVQLTGFAAKPADLAKVLSLADNVPRPSIDRSNSREMVIRVLACSLSPGDWRRINGSMDFLAKPKKWPHTPGHDVCGIVEEVPTGCPFKVGDRIATSSTKMMLPDGLAEYAVVEVAPAALVPDEVGTIDAAAMPTSGARAWMTRNQVKKGDRVLVLGASGGFGHMLLQVIQQNKPSFVAVTSTQRKMMEALGVDRVLDHTTEDWSTVQDFKKNKFDVIIDAAEGLMAWKRCGKVLKPAYEGGRFVAVTMDNPEAQVHNIFGLFGIMKGIMFRPLFIRLCPMFPRYLPMLYSQRGSDLAKSMELVKNGTLKISYDPLEPLPFTKEGVIEGFSKAASRKAHGKIVVKIAEE